MDAILITGPFMITSGQEVGSLDTRLTGNSAGLAIPSDILVTIFSSNNDLCCRFLEYWIFDFLCESSYQGN